MRKRHLGLSIVLSLVLIATLDLPCFAATTSQLHIVRASDGSLWKMTCVGLTCSGFTSFPGNFASQPSVTWDESINRYVVMGVATGGSIWRSTFDIDGNFQNDWVTIPGNSASPVGSASGDLFESHVWTNSSDATTAIGSSCTNYSGGSVTVNAPSDGVIVVEADVWVHLSKTDAEIQQALIMIGETVSDCTASYYNKAVIFVPGEYPVGISNYSIHVTRSFSVSAGTKTFYLNGLMTNGQGTGDAFYYANMKAVYYPY